VDERLVGRRHRYGYALQTEYTTELNMGDALLKHDLVAGRTEAASLGKGRSGSEFVFIPSSADAAEDDGVLMGFVYDSATDLSELAILDARTLEPVGAVHLPARVPNGFHGNWAPTE